MADKSQRSVGYSETRRYILHNDCFNRQAEMDVRAIHREDGASDFAVLRVSGFEQIFKRILEGEAALSRLPSSERNLISANYAFKLSDIEKVNSQNCYVLSITPRRKSKYLLQGRAWIDTATFRLVKIGPIRDLSG